MPTLSLVRGMGFARLGNTETAASVRGWGQRNKTVAAMNITDQSIHRSAPRSRANRQVPAAMQIMTEELSVHVDLTAVARACRLSAVTLSRAFRRTTGMPPLRWLRARRIEHALCLMTDPTLSLSEIAYRCGFSDQSHFTRVFAATMGQPPGCWRRGKADLAA
jgi:AraC family transcriptional regulator